MTFVYLCVDISASGHTAVPLATEQEKYICMLPIYLVDV